MQTPLATAWQNLLSGRFAQAIVICDRLLAEKPDSVSALSCRGMASWSAGKETGLALADLKKAITLAPADSAIRHNLATVLASIGDFAGARKQFRQALAINPDDGAAFLGLAQISTLQRNDPDLKRLLEAYENRKLPQAAREYAAFGLAKAFDDLGEPERAIKLCLEANAMVKRPFDAAAEAQRLAALEKLSANNGFADMARSSYEGPSPIFVMGMPRSGTTLVEALLAEHDEVFGASETGLIGQVEAEILAHLRSAKGYKVSPDEALCQIDSDTFSRAAKLVEDRVRHLARQPLARFVDKTPDNTFRIGLIAALFPNAKVINVRRHPLDCGISNLFTRFHAGQAFAFSQENIGTHFRTVVRSVELWKQAGVIDIMDVSYEALVTEPEVEARRLFAFADLEWNPAYLDVAGTKRVIQTASHWQVRQPITNRSVNRWQAYERWLGPMIEAMGGMEWIEDYVNQVPDDQSGFRKQA